MTRRAKTMRNFGIMLVILAIVFWQSALYLTSEACVMASAEELGYGTCEIIRRDAYENGDIYVLRDADGNYAIYRAERVGPFWHAGSGSGGMNFQVAPDEPIFTGNAGNQNFGYCICKRYDPDIARIAWVCKNGEVIAADDWTDDIILTVIPGGWENTQGMVRAYDAAGKLVYEKEI